MASGRVRRRQQTAPSKRGFTSNRPSPQGRPMRAATPRGEEWKHRACSDSRRLLLEGCGCGKGTFSPSTVRHRNKASPLTRQTRHCSVGRLTQNKRTPHAMGGARRSSGAHQCRMHATKCSVGDHRATHLDAGPPETPPPVKRYQHLPPPFLWARNCSASALRRATISLHSWQTTMTDSRPWVAPTPWCCRRVAQLLPQPQTRQGTGWRLRRGPAWP